MSTQRTLSYYQLSKRNNRRLLSYMTLVIALSFGFLWWVISGTVDRNIERVIKNYGQSLTDSIAVALMAPVAQGDNQEIKQTVKILAEDPVLMTIEVFEEDGTLLAQHPEPAVLRDIVAHADKPNNLTRFGKSPRLFVKSIRSSEGRIGFIAARVDISRLDKIHKKMTHRSLIAGLLCLIFVVIGANLFLKRQMTRVKFN